MGKAIVIKDLTVTNPLVTVTFLNEDNILASYLASNTSISNTEEAALKMFVKGLLDSNLWIKMRYFYPMLGNTVEDMLLDVISPATEDLMKNISSTTELSISERKLLVGNNEGIITDVTKLLRFKNTDWKNFGIVTSTYHGALNQVVSFYFGGQTGNYSFTFTPLNTSFTERPPRITAGYSGSALSYVPVSASTDERTYVDRIVFGQVNNAVAQVYKENSLYATGTSYVNDIEYLSNCKILGGVTTSYKFFAITNNLTQEEYATFYGLLLTFLQSVGKHA